jgi:hypothetical protein
MGLSSLQNITLEAIGWKTILGTHWKYYIAREGCERGDVRVH